MGTKQKLQKMRDSVLTRSSVRLSVIPQDIMNKLRRKPQVVRFVSITIRHTGCLISSIASLLAQESKTTDGGGVGFSRLAAINKPEWKQGFLGVCASAALGLQMPGETFLTCYELQCHPRQWACIHIVYVCRLCFGPCWDHWSLL